MKQILHNDFFIHLLYIIIAFRGGWLPMGVIPLYPLVILSPGQFLSYKTFFK